MEGTAYSTDEEETVSTVTLCGGALRSSFDLAVPTVNQIRLY
jgi:hypothetical protein